MSTEPNLREVFISIIEQHSANTGINGRYHNATRIDNDAGQGKFSLVFKASDIKTGNWVALKFFNPIKNDDLYRRLCFCRESEILQLLCGQPNIIKLVEARSQCVISIPLPTGQNFPLQLEFIAMELAHSNVKQYIYEGKPNVLKSLVYFREMCKAVQRVHANQIRHRDLKLDQFFIIGRGNISLGDFGSARFFGGSALPLSDTYPAPFWRGETFYTAPEMFGLVTEDSESFRRADIYCLGAILFEMFAKQQLYPYVFNERFNSQILQIMHYGATGSLLVGESLAQTVRELVRDVRLPEIYDFNNDVPLVIRERLNRLCKGMANLDHNKRKCDFQDVFSEINRCIEVLQNRRKYERWIELRKLWNERRKQHLASMVDMGDHTQG